MHGDYLFYSYEDEGFTNWAAPMLLEVWFAPLNGLILYTPMVLIFLAGMIVMIRRKSSDGWYFLILFFILSYVYASWHTWYFCCNLSQRSFVEYYSLFIIPFAYLIEKVIRKKHMTLKIIGLVMLFAVSYYNIRMTFTSLDCFFGSTWDWNRYIRHTDRAGIYLPFKENHVYQNDFENRNFPDQAILSTDFARSGMHSGTIGHGRDIYGRITVFLWELGGEQFDSIRVNCWAYKSGAQSGQIEVECYAIHHLDTLFEKRKPVDVEVLEMNKWSEIGVIFPFPDIVQ
ncbi:MAG: hypothetical protein KAR20_10560, partial [Candidatus Heimdallarchaeota archaeon]|nr:hypothetical protein [Candidatus Heimdallarchaeota archaeon]